MFKGFLKTTNRHKQYWAQRKINWYESYFTPDHPHRALIIQALKKMKFATVFEIGCGVGANLWRVVSAYPNCRVGGVDINAEAIAEAKKHLPINALVEARSFEDIFMNDKSVCVLISDACLIYCGPLKIRKVLKEITRITRNGLILVEFYLPFWWQRLALWWRTGYFAHNWLKLLTKYGFYDVELKKLTEKDWPGGDKYPRYLIQAKI